MYNYWMKLVLFDVCGIVMSGSQRESKTNNKIDGREGMNEKKQKNNFSWSSVKLQTCFQLKLHTNKSSDDDDGSWPLNESFCELETKAFLFIIITRSIDTNSEFIAFSFMVHGISI